MVVWRLARHRYAALTGVGGVVTEGRWHHAGRPIVYATENLALAVLEVRVRAKEPPLDYVATEIEIPDAGILKPAGLPLDWKDRVEWTRAAGDAWLESAASIALAVPSAVVAGCWNYLLNPSHRSFDEVILKRVEPFDFDIRLLH